MNVLIFALILWFTGISLLAAGSINYQIRAFYNKKAWLGLTKPYLYAGAPASLLGLLLIFINF
ncbi:hypothetical protein [Candidatus Enterococcus clewellii]|uniref:Uncharacterized protein n=1 Tax=Candidatus Enterococcus clewellii TaxID=1834193 RepID=A0A242KAZ4_9ENTE|nr:hypothetical protein [Enterococcus sp. 9E7_DIV0242]OTP18345.1 hypothetical protein A5888_000159 [Enterococcus sp. 9E7_DIV0242]